MECVCLCNGARIGYGSSLTLMDGSPGLAAGSRGDCSVLRPTHMPAVPLILDKLRSAILAAVVSQGKLFSTLFNMALGYEQFWRRRGFRTPLISKLFFTKTKGLLGGNLQWLIYGAAPISQETQDFIRSVLNCTTVQAYGATETVAVISCMDVYDMDLGHCGATYSGVRLLLEEWDEGGYYPKDLKGEILIGGDHITMGE